MAIWNEIFERRSGFNTLAEMVRLARREKSGDVSVDQAITLTAVFRAVNIIASTVASLPLKAHQPVKVQDGALVPLGRSSSIPVHDLRPYDLLKRPNPHMTGFELREVQTAHLALWGNSYTLKIRDGSGRVKELWPIDPGTVSVKLEGDRKLFEIRPKKGKAFVTDATDIMHIPGFGYNGVTGLSPIAAARENISEQLAARKYASGVYHSGAIAAGLITTPMRLKKEQAEEIKQRWKDSIGGFENAGDIGILDQGFKFEKMSIDPRDLQFLETRKFGVVEIARIYGVPPHLLMDVDRSTSWGTGIEEQTLGFITYTLHPGYLARIEKRYTEEVLPKNLFAEFSVEGLLRTRARDRADVYTRALSPFTGWMTRAEVRELENLPAEEEPEKDPKAPAEETPAEEVPAEEEEPQGQPAQPPVEPTPEAIPGVRSECDVPNCHRMTSQVYCLWHRDKPTSWYRKL